MGPNDRAELLNRVDRYLHAVPLSGARAHEVGRFTLFRSTTVWSYYARPRLGTRADPITALDVEELRVRCQQLGLPLSLEWVQQCAPSLADAAAGAGLAVVAHPLLMLTPEAFVPSTTPAGVRVEIAAADRQTLVTARAVADVSFGTPGTQVGEPGVDARDSRMSTVGAVRGDVLLDRARNGVTVTAIALGPDGRPVASGQHQPVHTTSEIVAVATLPAFRRRGLGSAVTSTLVEHAFGNGVDLVLLSAQTDDVARIYEKLGFARIGAVGSAEPVAPGRREPASG